MDMTIPRGDGWASCDRRQRTMITMGKSSWDGEGFRIADPRRTFTLQRTCNNELLGSYFGEIEKIQCGTTYALLTPPLTRVIAGLHNVADSLGILGPRHTNFRDLAED